MEKKFKQLSDTTVRSGRGQQQTDTILEEEQNNVLTQESYDYGDVEDYTEIFGEMEDLTEGN